MNGGEFDMNDQNIWKHEMNAVLGDIKNQKINHGFWVFEQKD